MDKNERIIAITRILPGLETFLRHVLANESLSTEAERQRLGFVKELEQLTKPPGLPPRPANLKSQSQSRASVDSVESVDNDDFASVQRKLSNIFYVRRDFDELKDHFVNGTSEEPVSKNTSRKPPVKSVKKKTGEKGIYEHLQTKFEVDDLESGVLSEEEGTRVNNRSISLARGAHIRQSLSRGKWFAKKEKSIGHDVYVSDLQLSTISGHLIEVRTNKRRWCVLKDQHLYIFKNQEEPAHFVIALPGCDISTVPRGDKSKVSYSFKITQNGVAAVILGIEDEKDLSAWMNALITAAVAKNPLSPPPSKISKSLPRAAVSPWSDKEESSLNGQRQDTRRHTFGSYPGHKLEKIVTDIDIGTYEQPTDALGLAYSLDTENYNPPLPPLPGEINEIVRAGSKRSRPGSKYSGIYEEVGEEFLRNLSEDSENGEHVSADTITEGNYDNNVNVSDEALETTGERMISKGGSKSQPNYSEGATSDSEYSSDDEPSAEKMGEAANERWFHDRWAVHSGVLHQKRASGWNRRYCKIVDNCLKGFRNPDDMAPVLELSLSACNVRVAEPEGKRKFIFQLNTADGESLYFNTDTEESLERWLEVISVAATSRRENSVTLSEEELDKVAESSDDHLGSCDSIPSPVPERVESLKRARKIADAGDAADDATDSEKEKNSTSSLDRLSHDDVTPERWNSDPSLKAQSEKLTEKKGSDETSKPDVADDIKEPVAVWKRRDNPGKYATAPRSRNKGKITKSFSLKDSSKSESTHGLSISPKSATSPQEALHISKKNKYLKSLEKYLDKNGQFSGYILELSIQPNSTNLTRRWAVVQNGFLRIYENYGCAAPFLRISLVEAFLKDFSNVEKSRFCFMLEYGAGQSILFQTNTNQELKRWVTVITLSIACHTDLFGSGVDLRRTERITGNHPESGGNSSGNLPTQNASPEESTLSLSRSVDEVDGPEITSPGSTSDVFEPEVTSRITNEFKRRCDCDEEDKVSLSCTPTVVKELIHRKSYNMGSSISLDSDDNVLRDSHESFVYRSSLMEMVKYRGYLHVLRGTDPPVVQFCELKGSLFSIYPSERSENPKQVFNLLYDKYREVTTSTMTFALTNDGEGTVEFGCETKKDFEAWGRAISSVALQEANSCDDSPQTSTPRYCKICTSDSAIAKKQSSLRASFAEEEAKHHDVLRSLDEELTNGDSQCDYSDYKCYVYEVRDSSGNKTIIRRWCVVSDDVIQIFERETSREAVNELRPSAYRLEDIDNPRDFPFAFRLCPLDSKRESEECLVYQASNMNDFRELVRRIKSVQGGNSKKPNGCSKSESNIHLVKKHSFKGPSPLNHSKSDLSLKKEVKRIFHLARKSSKGDLLNDATPSGQNTWPKVIRRERRSGRRALSDTGTERPRTNSLIENTREVNARKSVGHFYDSDGKFSGYLTEVRNSELCRSEVRKWCVVHDRQFAAYDDKDTKSPSTVIELKDDVELVDLSHVYPSCFEVRVNNGVIHCHLYRAPTDFHKWLTVLTVALDCHAKLTRTVANGSSDRLGTNAKRKDPKKDAKPSQSSRATHGEDTAL